LYEGVSGLEFRVSGCFNSINQIELKQPETRNSKPETDIISKIRSLTLVGILDFFKRKEENRSFKKNLRNVLGFTPGRIALIKLR